MKIQDITRDFGKMPLRLRAIHQFHAGSARGDGITNGMLLTRSLLQELGFISDIYALHVAPELLGNLLPHTVHPGANAAPDELLLVHYSLGHDAHAWVDTVACPKILIYHNITPVELLRDETLRRYSKLGRQQLGLWGKQQETARRRPFLGALADSCFNAQELHALGFGRSGDPVEVLPLLVDLEGPLATTAGAPPEAPLPQDAPASPARLLFVGRLVEHKCQHDLLTMFAHLRPRLSRGAVLTLVGSGDEAYLDRLRALAVELRIEDALVITGKVPEAELAANYRSADLFVCLSDHEGFCMPLIEASVHGIPILAYNKGAVAETLGEGGLILQQKDPTLVAAGACQRQ